MESGSLNLLEFFGPHQTCYGTAFIYRNGCAKEVSKKIKVGKNKT
jgi:hypothetical protein